MFDGPRSLEPLIRRVYAYVAYRVGDGADAEDITAAVFERAFRYKQSFDAERGGEAAWLVGIARRQISVHFAEARASVSGVSPEVAFDDPSAQLLVRFDLQRALGVLSERDRELLALRYGGVLTARQIAKLLNMTTNAVEVALHRALARLRDRLEEKPAPESSAEPQISPAPL